MRLITINLLFLVISFFGCSKDNEYSDEVLIFIDSKYVDTPSNIYPVKSLNIKIGDENQDWIPFYNDSIEGFFYEEGFFYKLLVKRTFIKDPPQDGSNVNYELIKIIEKLKKNDHEKES